VRTSLSPAFIRRVSPGSHQGVCARSDMKFRISPFFRWWLTVARRSPFGIAWESSLATPHPPGVLRVLRDAGIVAVPPKEPSTL